MEPENDLILGDEEQLEEELDPLTDYYDFRAATRADIDTAMVTFNFLEEVDLEGPDVLKWQLSKRLKETKRKCLLLIEKSINNLSE